MDTMRQRDTMRRAAPVQGRSLWGRLLGRQPASGKERAAAPLTQAPRSRPLRVKDTLWTLDAATGRRVYVPLVVDGVPGRWAGREWQHCGERERVLLVAWAERDDAMAAQHGCVLADGAVRVVEGG